MDLYIYCNGILVSVSRCNTIKEADVAISSYFKVCREQEEVASMSYAIILNVPREKGALYDTVLAKRKVHRS